MTRLGLRVSPELALGRSLRLKQPLAFPVALCNQGPNLRKQGDFNHLHCCILAAARLSCKVVVALQIGLADFGHDPTTLAMRGLRAVDNRAGRAEGKARTTEVERAYDTGRVMLMHDVQAQLQIAGGLLHSLAYGKAP